MSSAGRGDARPSNKGGGGGRGGGGVGGSGGHSSKKDSILELAKASAPLSLTVSDVVDFVGGRGNALARRFLVPNVTYFIDYDHN
jgi:hypothetical protein